MLVARDYSELQGALLGEQITKAKRHRGCYQQSTAAFGSRQTGLTAEQGSLPLSIQNRIMNAYVHEYSQSQIQSQSQKIGLNLELLPRSAHHDSGHLPASVRTTRSRLPARATFAN